MPNSEVPKRPRRPISVLVLKDSATQSWDLGVMREWRWIHEAAGTWEGHVDTGAGGYKWVEGTRLRRTDIPAGKRVLRRDAATDPPGTS